ncbi:MAG: bifunctional oligoribonuclease/PAP phosphatase NrnA [Treponema sp.]|jgi:phosphoesterase RecJ-like protein|nr:bifunctional oligoribonuclease/PAP phosphatase NrnA [Treponema sp.]
MTVPVPQELLDFITMGSKFLIAGHREPDGDCVGSQLALASALRRLGKQAIPCSAGPFKRPEIKGYEPLFTATVGAAEREGACLIIMDCAAASRTGDLASALEGLPTAVVDHHAAGECRHSSASAPVFLDAAAPSVTFMTLALIEALGLTPTQAEAELLFFGLCTDTGFFRHLDERGDQAFEYAARLIRCGVSPKRVYACMNGGKSLGSRYLLAIQLERVRPYFNGKLLLTSEEYAETQRFGLEGRDSDSLYQLLQVVSGVEAVVIIRQEGPETCTVGLRSRDTVDVAAIAASFGGGGHKNAAGILLTGTIQELQPRILDAFQTVFGEAGCPQDVCDREVE